MSWPGLHTTRIVLVFGFMAFASRRRATHARGVAATGTIKVVTNPTFPAHPFFRPGRTFPCVLRHANVQIADDAGLDVRGCALKFSDQLVGGSFDLPMNTGETSIFNDANVFWDLIRSELPYILFGSHRSLERFYLGNQAAMRAEQDSVRRAPASYAQLRYHGKLVFAFRGEDGHQRGARYRIIPDPEPPGGETGLPLAEDVAHPWIQERHPKLDLPEDYLRREFRERLSRGPIGYRLQIQIADDLTLPGILDSSQPWPPERHPWHDLARVTLHRALPEHEAEKIRFSLGNHPDSLGTLPAQSASDPNSVADLRKRAYRLVQRFRFAAPPRKRPRCGQPVTVLLPVRSDSLDSLRIRLDALGDRAREDPRQFVGGATGVHFARWALIEPERGRDGRTFPAQLVYSAIVDLAPEAHIDDLVAESFEEVRQLCAHCSDVSDDIDLLELRSFLNAHRIREQTYYSGAGGLGVDRIGSDAKLVARVQEELSRSRDLLRTSTPTAIVRQIRENAVDPEDPTVDRSGAASPGHCLQLAQRAFPLFATLGLVAWGLARWTAAIPVNASSIAATAVGLLGLSAVGWLLALRRAEATDWVASAPPTDAHLRRLAEAEDYAKPNAMTLTHEIRPGAFRALTLRVVLWIADVLARYHYRHGKLVGVGTIHAARFYLIDEGRRMLFLSEYDGSWDLYLDDFLSVGAGAVVPIWTNVVGCPRTRFLVQPAPGFSRPFRRLVRRHQHKTNVHFAAHPHLTVNDVVRNEGIRAGLRGELDERGAQEWLDAL